jgi:hypothetical protein
LVRTRCRVRTADQPTMCTTMATAAASRIASTRAPAARTRTLGIFRFHPLTLGRRSGTSTHTRSVLRARSWRSWGAIRALSGRKSHRAPGAVRVTKRASQGHPSGTVFTIGKSTTLVSDHTCATDKFFYQPPLTPRNTPPVSLGPCGLEHPHSSPIRNEPNRPLCPPCAPWRRAIQSRRA